MAFDPNKTGTFEAYRKPSSDWGLICLFVIGVAIVAGMLVVALGW